MSVLRFIRWIASGEPVSVFGDGSQERDFTYIDDVARGVLAALKPVGYETFNIGWDWPVKVTTLIEMIETAVGHEAVIEYHDSTRADAIATWAYVAKARRVLNWEPRVTLIRGPQEKVT
jgi:UDP-glucuronate 4-epimerase